jgi:hypothetical protein
MLDLTTVSAVVEPSLLDRYAVLGRQLNAVTGCGRSNNAARTMKGVGLQRKTSLEHLGAYVAARSPARRKRPVHSERRWHDAGGDQVRVGRHAQHDFCGPAHWHRLLVLERELAIGGGG